MMGFVKREDDESERQRGKRRPLKNDRGDRESLVRVDSAATSRRCQLDSGDVFSRHWLLKNLTSLCGTRTEQMSRERWRWKIKA